MASNGKIGSRITCSVVHQDALAAVSSWGWVSPSPASTTAGPATTTTRTHRRPDLCHTQPRPTKLPPTDCRAPCGRLPTRQVVVAEEPHPPVQFVACSIQLGETVPHSLDNGN